MAALGSPTGTRQRYELAGPDTLTHTEIVRLVLDSLDRPRPLLKVPTPIVSRSLRLLEATLGRRAFATWDEAELMECSMLARSGADDAERLGVTPKPMRAVLGVG
jgi:NADH dehydrogenase